MDSDRPLNGPWPPLIFAACAGLGYVVHRSFPLPISSWSGMGALGGGFSLAALVLVGSGVWVMKRRGTHVRPDRPTLSIVTTGPYRLTRNPMYLAFALLQLALGCWLNDWAMLAAVLPLVALLDALVIRREERYLEEKFGGGYLEYKSRVRRWL